LFEEVRPLIELSGGTLSVEDTILDKPYAQEGKTELVGYFWSRKHGRAVKGVCLVTLFYSDSQGVRVPVNFRVVDKAEAKTKNELFRAPLVEVLGWGLHPARVSAESWDSGLENLKFLRTQELAFLVGLEKNRILSECEQEYRLCRGVGIAGGRKGGAPARLWFCQPVSKARIRTTRRDTKLATSHEKKAHETYPWLLPARAPPALGRGGLPPRPQTSLPCREVHGALEDRYPQPSLLRARRLRSTRSLALARPDQELV
jgi:hypothetical protein